MISLQKVSKHFKRGSETITVLDNFSLEVDPGEFVAVVGPSGSGKTTILNVIAGLDSVNSGTVAVANTNLCGLTHAQLTSWRARNVGFIFQFYHLLPGYSAERNVEVPLLLTRMSAVERRRRVAIALELVGLTDRRTHLPSELSGGQQQRVAIARAIIADPTLLVCDEPTGDLDRATANDVLELLRQLRSSQGKTIVMATHDLKAAASASRLIALDKGKLIEDRQVHLAE